MTITVSTADPRSIKALALLESADKWLKIRRKSDGAKFYVIEGNAGHVYWVNLSECSCPDSQQHRGVECKHITAVKLHCAKVQGERPVRRSRRPQPISPEQADRLSGDTLRLEMELERRAVNAAKYHEIFSADGDL